MRDFALKDCASLVLRDFSLSGMDKVATRLLPDIPAAPWGSCPMPLHPTGVCVAVGSTVTLLLPLQASAWLGQGLGRGAASELACWAICYGRKCCVILAPAMAR